MARQIKGFITCDSFTDNAPQAVSSLYEISDIALTYSTKKQQYYSSDDAAYSLYVFNKVDMDSLSQTEVNTIVRVIKDFVTFATDNSRIVTPQQLVINFTNNFNFLHHNTQLLDMSFTSLIDCNGVIGADYLNFSVLGIDCSVWMNDECFRAFYPDYEISIVTPFETFNSVVSNGSVMLSSLSAFNLVTFNRRIELAKANNPTTHVSILNIPYSLPNSTVKRDCFFAFIQYGNQGNFDYILKLKLYDYLLALGLTSGYVETIFPTILQINEFFITPRWTSYSLPSRIGFNGILSQVSKAFSQVFDLNKYIRVYPDLTYLQNNSYSVPYDYNNVLLTISNGYYTDPEVKDFATVYSDIISVTSASTDFARMSTKTQHLVSILESMLVICDSDTTNKMFSKMTGNRNYNFTMVKRGDVWYLTLFYDGHQYYMIPKYEYVALT